MQMEVIDFHVPTKIVVEVSPARNICLDMHYHIWTRALCAAFAGAGLLAGWSFATAQNYFLLIIYQ